MSVSRPLVCSSHSPSHMLCTHSSTDCAILGRMVGDRVVEARRQQLFLSEDVLLGYLLHADGRILLAEYRHVNQMSNASFDRDVDDVCLSRLAVGKGVGRSQHQLLNTLESP